MRAFIFSLDAFVAFTLALIAIYSLIFFSSVPSSYYYLLTQGHYFSRDILVSLSTTICDAESGRCENPETSLLDNIVSQDGAVQEALIINSVGNAIPNQFGYVIEMSEGDDHWSILYNTADDPADPHAKSVKKMTVSSQVVTFGYMGDSSASDSYATAREFRYLSCGTPDSPIITCGDINTHNPSDFSGDLIPEPNIRIVRLTIFI